MDITQILLFALVIMCSYFIEGLIGFGGTLIAIPIASAIVGIKLTVPVLTIVVMIASLIIAIKDFKHIAKKEFLKISLLMIIGLPIGMALFKYLPEKPLKVALGIFMIIIAIKGLYDNTEKRKANLALKAHHTDSAFIKVIETLTIFLGGIIHGAFTCGGPFVVVYATKNIKDKFSFRATLCALWATLNGIMLTLNIIAGEISGEIVKVSFITMLFVIVAITASNIVIKKVNGEAFTKFIYIILCISGILMIVGK